MAAGAGEYAMASLATLVTLIVLAILPPLESYFDSRFENASNVDAGVSQG